MMSRREAGEGLRLPGRTSNCFKDRDEELSFFRDLKKREKDRVASLLQPVSDEFEANGNQGLYRMDSGVRKGAGLEFLAESGKNDYNWLKTPPATPLFPSLEMEANGQELVIQRELPIIQPLSRFAGNSEGNKKTTNTSKSPNLPQRQKTPTWRPNISSLTDKRNMKTAPVMSHKATMTCTDKTKSAAKQSQPNISSSNSNPKPISRGVSPFVRPKIGGFSDEAPPNLKTIIRPESATRGRSANQILSTPQKQETNAMIRRQSCSPSVARGRIMESDRKGDDHSRGSRGQVLGSRMVERFMKSRTSNADDLKAKMRLNSSLNERVEIGSGEDRQGKIKLNGSLNESSGFGRLMSKNSLDMAFKHMELQRESSHSRKQDVIPGRKS